MVKEAILKFLLARPRVSGIVGDHIYPYALPQGVRARAIDMRVVVARSDNIITGQLVMHHATVTLDCYSMDEAEATELAVIVRDEMVPAFYGPQDKINVRGILLSSGPVDDDESVDPGSDERRYVSSVSFAIMYAC